MDNNNSNGNKKIKSQKDFNLVSIAENIIRSNNNNQEQQKKRTKRKITNALIN